MSSSEAGRRARETRPVGRVARGGWAIALAAFAVGCGSLLGIDDVSPNDPPGVGGEGGGPGQAGAGLEGEGGGPPGKAGRGGGPIGGRGGAGGKGGSGDGGAAGASSGAGGGDGGAGGGPLPCDGVDPNGPNNVLLAATPLFEGKLFTFCDGEQSIEDVAAFADVDWFKAKGSRFGCFEVPTPAARVEPPLGAQVCYYFDSFDLEPATPVCTPPATAAPELPGGVIGCCGTDQVEMSYDGREASLFVVVRPSNAADVCAPYRLFYHY